jgi:hypothetical protein
MVLEFRNRIEADLGFALPLVRFLEGPSLNELTEELLTQLHIDSDTTVRSARSSPLEFPLAYEQRALWFIQRLMPESCAYNLTFASHVSPSLNLEVFADALNRLVARHEALRTIFAEEDGHPFQRVLPDASVGLKIVELERESGPALRRRLVAEFQQPFDLGQPLFRAVLYRHPGGEDTLLIAIHHIVVDGQSMPLLFRDLRELYRAALNSVPPSLPPIQAHYHDFVDWQARLLESPEGDSLWTYWRSTLAGELPALQIEGSKPRPPMLSGKGASLRFSLNPELSLAIHDFVRDRQITLFMFMSGMFQILLHAFTRQTDIVIGSPASVRSKAEWSEVIGCFINMLPIRAHISPISSLSDHLIATRESVRGAIAHQDFPFALMVNRLKVHRDASRTPVFQAMLNVQVAPRSTELAGLFRAGRSDQPMEFGGSMVTPIAISQQEGQFDITLDITVIDGDLSGNLKFNTDVIDTELASRMRSSFLALLDDVMIHPDSSVGRLSEVCSGADLNRESTVL